MAEPVGAGRADEVFSMNMKQGQSLMDDIYNLMDKMQYQEAGKLAKRLVQVAEKNGWQQLLNNALEMLLVIAIETNNLIEADEFANKLEKQPATAYGLFLHGRLFMAEHKNHEALVKGREALIFAQNHRDTTSKIILEKICNLLGKLLSNYGYHDEAIKYYWQGVEAADSLQLKALEYSNYLFNLHFVHNSPIDYFKAHAGYNDLFKDISWYKLQNKYLLEAIYHKPVGKLRIGYISPDLRYHVVLRFSWAMLANYDKEHFEVYCYHNNPVEDEYSEEIKTMTDGWRNISGMNAKDAAEVIYRDKIDILVDLAGHTKGSILPILAYKPAPVQISGIGYFATTGLKAVDYFLSDKALQSESQYFCEDIIELEYSHFCYTPLYEAPATQEAPCKKNHYITFGSFNAIRKINDEVLELWTNIIKAVSNSHLLLKGSVFDDEYGYELFCDRLAKFGININLPEWQNRIELRGFSRDYLQEYLDIDIALDTFPYPGGGTTCDALYMGVPVITLSGNSHGERFGKSLLENIGLSEFVVYDKQAYFDLAVALAGDKEIINNLHMGLRRMMEKSPLMDRKLYMGELEAAYKNIWQKYVGELKSMECPTSKEALNYSFDCYSAKDYERAEEWCRIALEQDRDNKYSLEATGLLSDILQEKLDYVAAWQESKGALELLEKEEDKGTKEFQRRLWVNYASRSLKLGYIDEAVNAYKQGAAFAVDGYDKFSLLGSALLARLCRTEDCEDVRQRLGEIEKCLPLEGKVSTQLTEEVAGKTSPAHSGAPSPEGRAKHKPSSLDVLPKFKAFPSGGGGHVVLGGGQARTPHPPQAVPPPLKGRAHIAYISPDFRQHVMFSFYYTMLHSYDKNKFKVTCISLTEKADGFMEHLKTLVDNWIDVSDMKWPEIIERLKKENIDILVDLAGHSADSGIPVFYDRVARVQISGLGWMESTGLGCTDYLITDRYIDPYVSNITEKPLYLTSQFCYTGRNDVPTPKGAPCHKKGYVTFGVFNHYHKITDEMLLAWKEIMARVTDSRLLIKCQLLVSESACEMVCKRLEALGLDISRIELEAATNTYMNRYLDVDIALDTYPYPGGGTTCDALYMGVPVISRYGKRRGSRFGLSILSNTGLGELAVSNINEYIERAVGLATDEELLDVLHKNLRRMMNSSPIMDGKKYMEELEKAYIDILAGK
ncbi:hypothetical protein [Anaerovibrio sp.]|uniref:O-linked N-acetylglucosamine transferase, SPINDLY family protein n=1 Tax=Anaerovibrio sp. TaxID=1872532 RepID=UPI0025C3AF03|nr:hypothetical protein [Anaerovibrio sp.]MBR2142018.1 hypothetical protein [Anaerovibrio sp.]